MVSIQEIIDLKVKVADQARKLNETRKALEFASSALGTGKCRINTCDSCKAEGDYCKDGRIEEVTGD